MLAQCLRDLIVIAETDGTPWTVEAFARDLGVSGAHLHREFKKHFGLTPKSFGASLNRDTHLRPGPFTNEVQMERQSGGALKQQVIDSRPAPLCVEPQDDDATLQPLSFADLSIEPLLADDPSPDFLDILLLDEFLRFDDD